MTLAISTKAKVMKAQGLDVVGFGAGEPDFDTPLRIKEAAKKAIDQGYTKYTPASGMPQLKEAIVKKFNKENGLSYQLDEILVGCGAKHVISEIIFCLVNAGDEVIIPAPYWVSYPEMVKLCGGVSVFVKSTQEDNFKITAGMLKEKITNKTKLLILNSPSNPTGAVYSRAELKALAQVIEEEKIYCISDEIYEKLVYDNAEHVSIAGFSRGLKDKTIVINGVSKAYSMTGWRIGYAGGAKQIIKIASSVQSHTTSNPTSISQIAAIEALQGPQDEVAEMKGEFEKRRGYLVEKIGSIKGLTCIKPQGAFYSFVDISKLLGKKSNGAEIKGSLSFSEILLNEAKVAVVPGIAFGDDNFVRLSYAISMETMKKGLDRIEEFVGGLK
ncbi:MAG: pyridoxal phosphate-dependent aminotransferase [Candidatus Omnitrophica bacterium]|nr:pyridoxal phosphate-dependent aminotransferase [Candidatus Omnitrophota bacterium]